MARRQVARELDADPFGELRGTVTAPGQRGPAFIGKLGVDRQMNKDLRVRLTGSLYKTDKAMSNTLYTGEEAQVARVISEWVERRVTGSGPKNNVKPSAEKMPHP